MNYAKLETELKKMFKYIKKDGDTIYLSNNNSFWGYVVTDIESYTYGDRDEKIIISEFNNIYLNLLAVICRYYSKNLLENNDVYRLYALDDMTEISKICQKYFSDDYISDNLVQCSNYNFVPNKVNVQSNDKFNEFYYVVNNLFMEIGVSTKKNGTFYKNILEILLRKKIFEENILNLVDRTQISDEEYLQLLGMFVCDYAPKVQKINNDVKTLS